MSNPNPPAAAAPASRWFVGLGLIALAVYAAFIGFTATTAAGGADSSGYLNSARLLAEGKLLAEMRAPAEFGPAAQLDRMHFLPQGFFPYAAEPRYTPTYPTGLPLHFALAGKLLGWRTGPLLVVILAAVGAVWLCYACARELGLDRALAATGAAMLATFPVFLFTSLQPLSDTLATTWTLAALYAALRTRRAPGWAIGAGAAFAFAVLVRPTNLLFAPALVVLIGFDLRRLALFVIGGIPGAAWFAIYNQALYGSPIRSGYGDIFAAFAVAYGAPTAVHFAKWLALLLPAIVLVLPFAALKRPEHRRAWIALALGFVTITTTYSFYEISHEVWWCLRFILPVVPALILAALLGLDVITRRSQPLRWLATAALALWTLGNAWAWTRHFNILLIPLYEKTYADAALVAREHFPTNALVVANAFSGTVYFYSELAVLRYDQVEAAAFSRYAALAQNSGRPICALVFDWEEKEALQTRCPGSWQKLATVANVGLWQLSASTSPPAAK